jgi:hypothetical protein
MVRSIKKSNDLIGNLNRDLPACSIEPQPTTLPRAPSLIKIWNLMDDVKFFTLISVFLIQDCDTIHEAFTLSLWKVEDKVTL